MTPNRPNWGDKLFIVVGLCLALGSCISPPTPPRDLQKDQLEWLNRNLK